MSKQTAAASMSVGQALETIREVLAWPRPSDPEQEGRFADARKALNAVVEWGSVKDRARYDAETRSEVMEEAVRHVLRYGKVGKQSEARLRAALKAVEVSRG